jgi:hypothetical protein
MGTSPFDTDLLPTLPALDRSADLRREAQLDSFDVDEYLTVA